MDGVFVAAISILYVLLGVAMPICVYHVLVKPVGKYRKKAVALKNHRGGYADASEN